MKNRIVTRGLSKVGPNRLVARGFARGIIIPVVEAAKTVIRYGGSAARDVRDRVEEFVVSVKLIKVNDREPPEQIRGAIRVTYDTTRRVIANIARVTQATVESAVRVCAELVKKSRL